MINLLLDLIINTIKFLFQLKIDIEGVNISIGMIILFFIILGISILLIFNPILRKKGE